MQNSFGIYGEPFMYNYIRGEKNIRKAREKNGINTVEPVICAYHE